MIEGTLLRLALASEHELDEAIVDTLRLLGQTEHADRAYVTMFADDATFENSHEWCDDGIESHRAVIHDLKADDFPWSGSITSRGDVLAIVSLDDFPPEADAERASFGRFGVQSILEVPIFVSGTKRAILGFNHIRAQRRWAAETIHDVRVAGDVIAIALLRRESQRQIRASRDEAERANMAKDQFISQVSHELRTPLHAILGYAELLGIQLQDSDHSEVVAQIERSGRELLGFVQSLLELGRVISDDLGVRVRPVDLGAAIRRAVGILLNGEVSEISDRLSAQAAGIMVLSDEALLGRAIANLLTGASGTGETLQHIVIDTTVVESRCWVALSGVQHGAMRQSLARTLLDRLSIELVVPDSTGGTATATLIIPMVPRTAPLTD